MGIRIISFTEKGIELSQRVAEVLGYDNVKLFTKCSVAKEKNKLPMIQYVEEGMGEWAGKQMAEKHTLLFIGACGIAVRAIAPYITDKLHDSAVIVMEEGGNYIIPILSGHVGGANEIAVKIAVEIGAVPVITTATDINGKFAVDLFAKRNGLHIENKDGIAKVSSKVLAGKEICMAVEQGHLDENVSIPEGIILSELETMIDQTADVVITTKDGVKGALLTLKPKEYMIGIGCKRGKEEEKINQFILKNLDNLGISIEQIMAVVSIDKKKDEAGLVAWCEKQRIPFWTYTGELLQQIQGDFSVSDFVKEQVGVDNVCERAALKACGCEGKLIYKKHSEDGMTIAIAKREWSVGFDEK
jgi:cobalt-precorrin 5A hydrolase